MDRDDAGMSDRRDEALPDDTGMIGSDTEEPGPGRDTSLTDPDPVAASTDQPRGTVAMSEGDPMRTRLGSHVEGAGAIGHDVVAAEEGATQETPPGDRPGYEPERTGADEPLATAPAAAATAPAASERVEDAGSADRFATTGYREEPGREVPATYTGEEAEVTGRPEYADRVEAGGQALDQEEPQRLDRPGPQEPGVQQGVYDQEADRARRPSDGV